MIATERIITAIPSVTPTIAIETIGLDILLFPDFSLKKRLAMNNSVFKFPPFLQMYQNYFLKRYPLLSSYHYGFDSEFIIFRSL